MNFLITAGPTREYIDPVRFISNPSSGRQGFAIASEARKRGHNVILIVGPGTVEPPKETPLIRITTAEEMLKSVLQYKDWMDVLVMNAAVSDWKVVGKRRQKIKKKNVLNLRLSLNPDILTYISRLKKQGKTKQGLLLVGFSIDTVELINNAKKKLKDKNLDIVVANPVDTFGSSATESVIIDKTGTIMKLPLMGKKQLASRLIKLIQSQSA